MSGRTQRYDDVARLFEDADLAGVRYQEFGRHARPRPVEQSVPQSVQQTASSADTQSLPAQHERAAPSPPERPSRRASSSAKPLPQQHFESAVQAPQVAQRKLHEVSSAGGQPPSGESLRATFSRLVARAPEPAPRKLDLGLDLPPREPVAAEAMRRDERLTTLFSRLTGARSDDSNRLRER